LLHIPRFVTVSYAFCNRFSEELAQGIFEHILLVRGHFYELSINESRCFVCP